MIFPLNQQKLDESYIAKVEGMAEVHILAQYTAFKRASAALIKAFKQEIDTYGSIYRLPPEKLSKYYTSLNSLLKVNENLREDLYRQVNRNSKDLEDIKEFNTEYSFLNGIILRKRRKLFRRIEYFEKIEILFFAIDFYIS